MRIYLAKTLEGIGMFGPIFNLGPGVPDKVEEYIMEQKEHDWMLEDLIDKINEVCGTLLDIGDVDYIGADKCRDLIELLENLPDGYVPSNCQNIINVLIEYAKRAIDYNTGIEIEM